MNNFMKEVASIDCHAFVLRNSAVHMKSPDLSFEKPNNKF
jgi:hypothetical protein